MSGSPAAVAPPPRRLASISTAADQAVCSTKTIRRLIAQGDLTGYRLGARMIRVDLNELDEILRPIPAGSAA